MSLDHLSMLAPKAMQLGPQVARSTAPVRLGWEDVAGFLAKVGDGPALFARVVYAGQVELLDTLARYILVHELDVAQGWKFAPGTLDRLIRCAIWEGGVSASTCNVCHGRGHVPHGDQRVDCVRCHASGRQRLSERARAKACEIEWRTWRRTWSRRYREDVLSVIDRYQVLLEGGRSSGTTSIA